MASGLQGADEQGEHDRHQAVGERRRFHVAANGSIVLVARDQLGQLGSQPGQGGDVEQPLGRLGLQAGQHPAGERVVGEGVEEQLDQRRPVAREPAPFHRLEGHFHQGVSVGVHGRGEEGLLARVVGVDGRRRDAHVTGDVREGDASEAVCRETIDGGLEKGLAGPLALGEDRGLESAQGHKNEGLTVSVNS